MVVLETLAKESMHASERTGHRPPIFANRTEMCRSSITRWEGRECTARISKHSMFRPDSTAPPTRRLGFDRPVLGSSTGPGSRNPPGIPIQQSRPPVETRTRRYPVTGFTYPPGSPHPGAHLHRLGRSPVGIHTRANPNPFPTPKTNNFF